MMLVLLILAIFLFSNQKECCQSHNSENVYPRKKNNILYIILGVIIVFTILKFVFFFSMIKFFPNMTYPFVFTGMGRFLIGC